MRLRKYTYAYKTSDGIRHEGVVEATSRECAFAELRRRGIRAIKVVAADGTKANGEVRGVRKRVVAAVAIVAALAAGVVAFFAGEIRNQPAGGERKPQAVPRHQIYGDPALMEELQENGFAGVFNEAIDRYLAYFAQPGVMPDERLLARLRTAVLAGGGEGREPNAPLDASLESSREVLELRDIVSGMRVEMQEFLADGTSMAEYLNALSERQQEESAIYERVAAELEGERDESVREQKNAALRALGLKTVPRPRSARR